MRGGVAIQAIERIPTDHVWQCNLMQQEHLSGGHNPEAVAFLFPGISDEDNAAVADDKEARFRKLAGEMKQLSLRDVLSAPVIWLRSFVEDCPGSDTGAVCIKNTNVRALCA